MTQHHAIGIRTHFSAGESVLEPKSIVKKAKELGYTDLWVADLQNINGLPAVMSAAEKESIDVRVGVTLRIVDDVAWRRPKKTEPKTTNPWFQIKVYPRNEQGFRDLMDLVTKSYDQDHFYYRPQLQFDEVMEVFEQGNIVVTSSDVYPLHAHHSADTMLSTLANSAQKHCFALELVPVSLAFFDAANVRALAAHEKHGFAMIVSWPCLYAKDKKKSRDVMNAIVSRYKVNDGFALKPATDDYYLHAPSDLDDAITRAAERAEERGAPIPGNLYQILHESHQRIGDEVSYRWSKFEVCLPTMAPDPLGTLVGLVKQGWKDRLSRDVLGYRPPPQLHPQYLERLQYELSVLRKMGFENYFLLVHDVVSWCKTQGILVGPGRGSVGGSLVAFLLGITDVDPIRFGLIFERFINPDRIDLPDIDLDFMSSKRDKVIKRLIKEYGAENVANISNYTMLASSSAMRNVGSAFGLQESQLEASKQVPKVHGTPTPLQDAIQEVPALEQFAIDHPEVWEQATELQGCFYTLGQHAAGVIVAGEPVHRRACLDSRKGHNVVNWDKAIVEDFGLVKLDILGLSTLDILAIAADSIEEETGSRPEYTELPLEDRKVLAQFEKGRTIGIFQFESFGMSKLLQDISSIEPLTFGDLAAATALYRPGPMDSGLMDQFVKIKQGMANEEYADPELEGPLGETKGVIVYQEQVMYAAQILAGFSLSEADFLRKAMGKKDREKMASMKEQWVDGCSKKGMNEEVASALFDQIEAFAGYGFNKSHAVEYSVISYWTMWLKTYHPAHFYAACLSIVKDEKRLRIVQDAEAAGIELVPPRVNESIDRFVVTDGGKSILSPLNCAKWCSDNVAKKIMKAREAGPFLNRDDFKNRVEKRYVNSRVQDVLDRIGAFVEIEPGSTPVDHEDRVVDQKSLMPGLITRVVKADRNLALDVNAADQLELWRKAYDSCHDCSLAGSGHACPSFTLKQPAKFMVVFDYPPTKDVERGVLMATDSMQHVTNAIKKAGLDVADGYFTSLVKGDKDKGQAVSNEMILGCGPKLEAEIELLNPPVIIACGSKSARFLAPALEGTWEEMAGLSTWNSDKRRTIICGINPMMCYPRPEAAKYLDQVFAEVALMYS